LAFYFHVLFPSITSEYFLFFNITNRRTNFPNLFLSRNSTYFGQFLCPSSGVHSLYIRHWYMSYSFRAGPGWNCSSILVLLESCHQTCITYTSAECTVENSWWWAEEPPEHVEFLNKNKFGKLVGLLVLLKRHLLRCTVTWT